MEAVGFGDVRRLGLRGNLLTDLPLLVILIASMGYQGISAKLAFFAIAVLCVGACSGQNTSPQPCPPLEATYPLFAAVYPAPGASDVPDATSVLVYATSASPIPVALVAPSASPLYLQPAAVPSPLPTGAASPLSPAVFAVRLPSLTSHTSYDVKVEQTTINGCGPAQHEFDTVDTFTTQ